MTGHDGYIGQVMKPLLEEAGHWVQGMDTFYFSHLVDGTDMRDAFLPSKSLMLFIHLAALSNDRWERLTTNYL